MKRIFHIIFVLLALWQPYVNAQDFNDSRVMWGIRGAVDINLPSKWHAKDVSYDMFKQGLGGNLGAVCNIYLAHDFYLEPGLSVFYDTYSYDEFVVEADASINFNSRIHKLGFRLPIVMGYAFDVLDIFSMNVYTGPELSYVFSGGLDDKYKGVLSDEDYQTFQPFGKYGLHRRVDCAWKIGIGIPTEYATINIEAALGLTDICKGDISFTENRLAIGLTHYF